MPQGYALRNKGGCPAPADSGGSTWDNFYTCCPPDTYNKPNQYNTICRKGVDQPTLTQCANTTWDLYTWHNPKDDEFEYFCCLQGLQGIYSKESSTYGYFGCLNETDVDDDTMSALDIAVSGKVTTTTASTTSTTSASTTMTTAESTTASLSATGKDLDTTPSASSTPVNQSGSSTDSHHSTNTGAIVGGVVGGVAGAALIALLLFFLIRRSRAAKAKDSGPEMSQNPGPSSHAPTELPSSEPSELSGSTAAPVPEQGQNFGFYELEAKRDDPANNH